MADIAVAISAPCCVTCVYILPQRRLALYHNRLNVQPNCEADHAPKRACLPPDRKRDYNSPMDLVTGKILKLNGWPDGKVIGIAKQAAAQLAAQGLEREVILQ